MFRKKYTKTTAIALTTAAIFQPLGMSTNLFNVNAFAVESNQTTGKVEVLKEGTKLASANVTVKETTPSAVEISTKADITLNTKIEVEIPSDKAFDFQALSIRDELDKFKTLDVNISGNDIDIDAKLPIKQEQGFGICGWDIFLDYDENGEDEDYVTVTVRTYEFSFESDGKTYVVPPLEYETTVDLLVPGGDSEQPEMPEQPEQPEEPEMPELPEQPGGGTSQPDSDTGKPGTGTITTPSAANLSSVEIKGTGVVGNTLSADVKDINGNEVNDGLAYRWYRVDKIGAISETLVSTNSTYKLQNDDAYKYIKLVVANNKNSVVGFSGRISKKSSSGGGSSSSSSSSSSSVSNNSSNNSTLSDNNNNNNNNTSSNVILSQGSTAAIQQSADGSVKLVNAEGAPVTGWQNVGGTWYLGDTNGQALTGWQQVNGQWYLMKDSGAMTTGWQQVDGQWYLMNDTGAMTTGWQQVNGQWYLMKESGAMTTGWQQVDGKWYLMNDNGAMTTGWQQVGGKWYYLNESGEMLANTTVNGYKLGADGAWIK